MPGEDEDEQVVNGKSSEFGIHCDFLGINILAILLEIRLESDYGGVISKAST